MPHPLHTEFLARCFSKEEIVIRSAPRKEQTKGSDSEEGARSAQQFGRVNENLYVFEKMNNPCCICHARSNREALRLFFGTGQELGTLEQVLEEAGVAKVNDQWIHRVPMKRIEATVESVGAPRPYSL